MRRLVVWLVLSLGLLLPVAARAEGAGPAAIGSQVPASLTFTDTRFLPRPLADLQRRGDGQPASALALCFVTRRCPIARRYLPELVRLEQVYRARGVRVVVVDATPDPDVLATAAFGQELDLPLPLVKDERGLAAGALGVTRSPEVALLDARGRLRYRGRVDDRVRLGGARAEPTRRDLAAALDEVLSDAAVSVAETPVDGCLLGFPAPPPPAEVTWARDVAPLVARHCRDCHREGGAAPFPLVSFEDARSEGPTLAETVAQGRMPPWFAAEGPQELAGHRGLSAAERQTIVDWVRRGMPEGEPAGEPLPADTVPPPPRWTIGEPDLVLELDRPIDVPADGVMPYQYAVLSHRFRRDTWVQKLEVSLGDQPQVVHHVNVFYFLPGQPFDPSQVLTGRVPGSGPLELEPGLATLIPAGALLSLQIHYQPDGVARRSRVGVGLVFPRQPVRRRLRTLPIQSRQLLIPPGAPHHREEASAVFPADALAGGLFAHMHVRGKDVAFAAVHPDGRREPLLAIPSWSFDYQTAYAWTAPRRFAQGTRIECVAHYDNSAWNPWNPDPSREVRYGLQTSFEMLECAVFYVRADEELGVEVDPKTGEVR